ncbi:unnamed protein product [Clonostachys rhizophaga]|uniref:J domain-containing protein n=1 Tax=Clonostachys rhizophaga TaxID=160324 RepID=A0A9N9VI55_9HYPO|nr:unnamed protein product [Clonostachys rhizophaga]
MSNLLAILGWSFLPNLATSWVQSIFYGLTIRAGDPKPQPGSPRYASHRRKIHILVVTAYLLYTIYEADYEIQKQSSFYTDLGVSFSAVDRDIKSRFRRLAALHHPDKTTGDTSGTAEYFLHLKVASETLQDQAKRFAYERFGPDILRWQKTRSIHDFVVRGVLQVILPHYGFAAATIYVLSLFGYLEFGQFYRWLILIILCTFEVHTVTRPGFPVILNTVNAIVPRVTSHPPYLPFQIITLARKVTITTYIAMSQIGPLVATYWQKGQAAAHEGEKALAHNLDRLEATARTLEADSGRLMDMETAPFRNDKEATANLRGKMKEWLVQNTIRADPMVRDALGTSFKRRRVDAPAGAKGTR